MSISNAVLECVQILIASQNDTRLNPKLRLQLANILVRLKTWAGNVGVFASDKASVDYRLREDSDLVEVVLSMTKRLKECLHNAVQPPLLEESNERDTDQNQRGKSYSTTSSSSSASLALDSSVDESDTSDQIESLGASAPFIGDANEVIDRIYRLATVFRKPESSSENVKVRDFMKKLVEKGDVEELEDINDHVSNHMKAHFSKAPKFLVNRLIEAVIFRRIKIRYRQRHQEKLKGGLEPAFAAPAPYEERARAPTARGTLTSHPPARSGSAGVKCRPQPTQTSLALSSTNASSVNRGRSWPVDYERSIALSAVTRTAMSRRQHLDIPDPPVNDGQNKVECPYCLRMISQEEMRQPRWTRHILKDIEPFVCLFKDCDESPTLFKTVEEWLGHMQWQHTIVYSCQAVGHERYLFGSYTDLESHIQEEHVDKFTESQLPEIVNRGAIPAPNTLGFLNSSLSLGESWCVLCDDFDPQSEDAEYTGDVPRGIPLEQRMQSHILKHLENIALLSLPSGEDADEVDSGARRSSHALDVERQHEAADLPRPIFEDIITGRAEDERVPDLDEHNQSWASVYEQVKQYHLLTPDTDPIIIALRYAKTMQLNEQSLIEQLVAQEDKGFNEVEQSRIDPPTGDRAGSDKRPQDITPTEAYVDRESKFSDENGRSRSTHQSDTHRSFRRTAVFEPFEHFHVWVEKYQIIGTDGLGNEAKYIPYQALREYWQENRIYPILNASGHAIHVPVDDILARFLRIFSILAYISTTESPELFYIKRFVEQSIDDHHLPFQTKPDALSNAIDGRETFKKFRQHQWPFSPVTLGRNRLQSRELPLETVLPFQVEKTLSGRDGESTIVKKCKVDLSGGLPVDVIILKEFDVTEIEYSFKNEVDSYISLENKVPPHIYEQQFLKYYGSFKKGDKAFIMLEFADQGSLMNFFDRDQLPLQRREQYTLWSSLANLFLGLEHIHALQLDDPWNSNLGNVRGVHLNLKPASIFVFKRDSHTDYSYKFKIGDFSMSSFALVKTANKSIKTLANLSTKMYEAPEQSSRYAAVEDIDPGGLWDMDIWSLGCVLLECLVWMTCGSRGLLAFFHMRQKETDADPRHRYQGYSGCFHNGNSRLQAVDNMMKLIMEERRDFDDLSGPIGDLILGKMLIPSHKHRLEARLLLPRFEAILEAETRPPERLETLDPYSPSSLVRQARSPLDGISDRTPRVNHQAVTPISKSIYDEPLASGSPVGYRSRDLASMTSVMTSDKGPTRASQSKSPNPREALSYSSQPATVSPPSPDTAGSNNPSYGSANVTTGSNVRGYAKVQISEVLQWIEAKKRNGVIKLLPDYDRAMQEINGRKQLFVIDDSPTMRHHWNQVLETVKALGYLVKHTDADGLELFVTSNPTRPKKGGVKNVSTLVHSLEDHERIHPVGPCNMESSLGTILEHVKSGLAKVPRFRQQAHRRGINVYILTDAIWEGGETVQCGVEYPIKDIIRVMQSLGKTRTTLALQFIQFGEDRLGEDRLRYLGEDLGEEIHFDIVDHRHHQRDGVWHMLVGAISRSIDEGRNAGAQEAAA